MHSIRRMHRRSRSARISRKKFSKDEVQNAVVNAPEAQKWLEGVSIRKVIFIPKKIINIVVG